MVTMRSALVVSVLLAILGCGKSSTPGPLATPSDLEGDEGLAGEAEIFLSQLDGYATDSAEDTPSQPDPYPSDSLDADAPLDECAPPAAIGCPCEKNSDCLYGFCVITDDGRRCTATCQPKDISCLLSASEWCTIPGWALQKVVSPLFGTLWFCLPLHPKLCRPCLEDADCASWTEAVCLDYGPQGRYCATRCNDIVTCPEGFECVAVEGASHLDRACRLVEGECKCSTLSIMEGASTVCYSGEACIGERRCLEDGLSPCSAPKAEPEVCDAVDNDCDGAVDEEGAIGCAFYFPDNDGDGFGVEPGKCLCMPFGPYKATNNADCDDSDGDVSPGAVERCNGTDDNCNGQTDEEGAQGCKTYYKDADNDGYGISSDHKCLCGPSGQYKATQGGDCNDSNGAVRPGAPEVCNGIDDNCDGLVDPEGTCEPTPTRKICLDPGHGGSDPGAVGYVVEKDINLDIVLRFRDLLNQDTKNQAGGGSWQVFLTRDRDVYVSLEARVAYANNNQVDRFMSTHNNACGYCGGNGTETYWYTQGSAQSQNLATKVQAQVVAHLGTKDRGVKQADFYVLKYTNMPAILLEAAFVDHQGDAAKLANPAMRQEIARGQLHGLQQHYGYAEFDP